MKIYYLGRLLLSILFYTVLAKPQRPEINDQFELTTSKKELLTQESDNATAANNKNENSTHAAKQAKQNSQLLPDSPPEANFFTKIYNVITFTFKLLLSAPKISTVLKNVGTCIVNGAMDIISYYFPAPVIPLIASAAGMIIPFEPIVMLKEKMPVASYRRAFRSALSSFTNTFDRFKMDFNDDPYMTRRFNRRFMGESGEKAMNNTE